MSGALSAAFAGGAPGVINGALPPGADTGTASWSLQNDGSFAVSGAGAGDWVTPSEASLAQLYEVKVDVTAGAFDSGTTGTWLALSTTRTWALTGAGAATFTVSFREAGTGIARGSQAGLTLTAL